MKYCWQIISPGACWLWMLQGKTCDLCDRSGKWDGWPWPVLATHFYIQDPTERTLTSCEELNPAKSNGMLCILYLWPHRCVEKLFSSNSESFASIWLVCRTRCCCKVSKIAFQCVLTDSLLRRDLLWDATAPLTRLLPRRRSVAEQNRGNFWCRSGGTFPLDRRQRRPRSRLQNLVYKL